MTRDRTAPVRRLGERHKARFRLLLLTLIALLGPLLSGVRSTSVWVVYVIFAMLYSVWALRLSLSFADDCRVGYLLSFTDVIVLLPLLVWSPGAALRIVLGLICAAGFAFTLWADRLRVDRQRTDHLWADRQPPDRRRPSGDKRQGTLSVETQLQRAVNIRLETFEATGARFGLVVLRIVRFEEAVSYYGRETSERFLTAVGRRGLRLLGPDAQEFLLPRGRVAFVFETEPHTLQGHARYEGGFAWADPYDVEGLAMTVGRKACERLIDGQRVECVVGWAAAPADGLTFDDLLYVAETGAQSTAAFRRVAGAAVPVSERPRAATG